MSIYDELNGSNDWNGSVLAAILLAGSAGAMLPTLAPSSSPSSSTRSGLGVDLLVDPREVEIDVDDRCALTLDSDERDDSPMPAPSSSSSAAVAAEEQQQQDYVVCMRVAAMSAVSALFLLLFVGSWQVVASMCFLAGFFACWQYVNVVCLARYIFCICIHLYAKDPHAYVHTYNIHTHLHTNPSVPNELSTLKLSSIHVQIYISKLDSG